MKLWHSVSLILGALLTLLVEYLFLQTHGPYEQALDQIVWGLNHHDYSRWAVFPALLILPGVRAFHYVLPGSYGRGGLWGFRLFFSGLVLGVAGQIWDYVLFDPWEHPMHGVGFIAQLLAILLMTVGLPIWAFAILRARALSGIQVMIPILWVLYIVSLFVSIFITDEIWLYPRYGIDGSFIADVFMGFAYGLMGLALLKKEVT